MDSRNLCRNNNDNNILVGGPGPPRPEKYEFVNWDDSKPNFFFARPFGRSRGEHAVLEFVSQTHVADNQA